MITESQIADACNKAYLKLGSNAYFGNGFRAGVEFALEQTLNSGTQEVGELNCDAPIIDLEYENIHKQYLKRDESLTHEI